MPKDKLQREIELFRKMPHEELAAEAKRLQDQWSSLNDKIDRIHTERDKKTADLKREIKRIEQEAYSKTEIHRKEIERLRYPLILIQTFACQHPHRKHVECPDMARNPRLGDCGNHFSCLDCGYTTEDTLPGWDSDYCIFRNGKFPL